MLVSAPDANQGDPSFPKTQELRWLLLDQLLNFSVSANVLFCFLLTFRHSSPPSHEKFKVDSWQLKDSLQITSSRPGVAKALVPTASLYIY